MQAFSLFVCRFNAVSADAQLILLYYVKNTLSNTPTAWETLLGKQRQPQPYPDLTKPYADFLPEADGDPTEAETA